MSVILTEQFIEDVEALLSGRLVDVELDRLDYDLAYRMAKKTWQQKGADNTRRETIPLTVSPNVNTYDLPAEVTDVAEVIYSRNSAGFASDDPFAMSAFQQTFTYGMNGSVSGDYFMIYDLTRQVMDNNKIYLASEPNYRFDRRRKKLHLSNPPSTQRNWILDVYMSPTDTEYQDELWIINWTVAECKQLLGRAYRKLGTMPSPTGETQIDGDQLVQEAQQEKERLLEEIDNFTDGEVDGMGVFIG